MNGVSKAPSSTPSSSRAVSWWRAFWQPRYEEQEVAVARTRERVPESIQLPEQTLGRATSGCAATYGVLERCSFACTACYLDPSANAVPALPFEKVARQLDKIREELGPWGNTQITAGEVTLLPVEDLVRVLQYCREVQLSPMLMTHGQVLLEDPSYLERLVIDGHLDNMAVHIDTTQRGRPGLLDGMREGDLDPLRNRFAQLVRETRRRTGRKLQAAQNVTVTPQTLDDVPDVVRWAIANAGSFRMLSLQPVADVGRTAVDSGIGREALWSKVQEGLGVEANDRAWYMGHPDCSTIALMWVLRVGEESRVIEVTRRNAPIDRAFFRSLIADLGGWRMNAEGRTRSILRLAGRLVRRPRPLLSAPLFVLYRSWTERKHLARAFASLLSLKRPRLHPFVLVIHRFMGSSELESDAGRERIAACAFRVPVERADGELEMVSMCELNGSGLRSELNRRDRVRLRTPSSETLTGTPS